MVHSDIVTATYLEYLSLATAVSPRPPFIDPGTGEIDIAQIATESLPLGKLIAVFGVLSLIPYAIAVFTFPHSILSAILIVVAQFILAVGTGIVLMYIIVRGLQLMEE